MDRNGRGMGVDFFPVFSAMREDGSFSITGFGRKGKIGTVGRSHEANKEAGYGVMEGGQYQSKEM
jgi:hypothetical protein